MNKIKVQDIDFSLLDIMPNQGSKSTMYEDDNICYKMLKIDDFYSDELDILERKLMDMAEINIPGVYLPIDLIVNNDKLVGFTLDKFKQSIPLYDKFSGKYIDFKELFNYIMKACQILREIHQYKVICQDLSFDNILVDNNGNVAFCDLDGCCYNGYESPFISMPMKKLIEGYRKEKFVVSKNSDRISMLVSLYYLIFNKYLYNIPKRQLDVLALNVETINRTMVYVKDLLEKSRVLPEVPYLDELIVSEDDYILDKEKQFNLLRRILKK